MDELFISAHLRGVYRFATKYSHDDSTHVGALINCPLGGSVIGANRFSSIDQNLKKNLVRERKYPRIVHAEREAIYTAVRLNEKIAGGTMVCPWATCPECAQAIVLSGIREVIAHKEALDQTPERWQEALEIGKEILLDGGVYFTIWSGKLGECENLFDGEIWYP